VPALGVLRLEVRAVVDDPLGLTLPAVRRRDGLVEFVLGIMGTALNAHITTMPDLMPPDLLQLR
jgi:hypothetical protein